MKSDFLNLLARINKAGVDFVVIGGFAGVIHGCTLVTQDIDICCDFSCSNLFRLQQAIADLGPVHRMTPKKLRLELTAEKCKKLNNLYLDTDLGQLDCVSYVQGIGDFEKVKAVSKTIEVDKLKYRVLNIDALISSKKTLNRLQDMQAVRQLEAIRKLERTKNKEV